MFVLKRRSKSYLDVDKHHQSLLYATLFEQLVQPSRDLLKCLIELQLFNQSELLSVK